MQNAILHFQVVFIFLAKRLLAPTQQQIPERSSVAYALVRVESSRRVWEIHPEKLHTCDMNPVNPLTNGVFCFFFFACQIFGRTSKYISLGIFRPLRLPNSRRKKHTQIPFVNESAGAHRTRVQYFTIYIRRREKLGFCADSMDNFRNCLVIT